MTHLDHLVIGNWTISAAKFVARLVKILGNLWSQTGSCVTKLPNCCKYDMGLTVCQQNSISQTFELVTFQWLLKTHFFKCDPGT